MVEPTAAEFDVGRRACSWTQIAAKVQALYALKASPPPHALHQTKSRHNADDPDRSKNDPGTKKAERRRSAF